MDSKGESNDVSKSRTLPIKSSPLHSIQCVCDFAHSLTFRYLSRFSRKQQTSCSFANVWRTQCNIPKHAERMYQELLNSAMDGKLMHDSARQIRLDLGRTFPDEPYFGEGKSGRGALERVLQSFSKYDPSLGYVQGMNFIAGALLWHCTESDAFWLFVSLMEDFDLRDNYLASLPGLSKHCQIISLLLMEHLPRLHLHFSEHRVGAEMFATDWCLTLFGSLVPVNDMGQFLGRFVRGGWVFFYKVVMEILRRLEALLLTCGDVSEILTPLKPVHKSQKHWREFVQLLEHGGEKLNWQQLFERAETVQLDSEYILQLLSSFSTDQAVFTHP